MKQKLFRCLATWMAMILSLLQPLQAIKAAEISPVDVLFRLEEGGRIEWQSGQQKQTLLPDSSLTLHLENGEPYVLEILADEGWEIDEVLINEKAQPQVIGQTFWKQEGVLDEHLAIEARFKKSADIEDTDSSDSNDKQDSEPSQDPEDLETPESSDSSQKDAEDNPDASESLIEKVPQTFALSSAAKSASSIAVAHIDTFYMVPLPTGGGALTNSLWTLDNGYPAFCANSILAPPAAGARSQSVREINHSTLRKVLYYGYGGPDNRLAGKGYSGPQQVIITNDLASFAYCGRSFATEVAGGYNWNACMRSLWNEITSLPDPKDYTVVLLEFAGSGTNYLDQIVPKQPLVYGKAVEKGSFKIAKKSSNEALTATSSRYRLEGARFEIRKGDSWDSGEPAGNLTTGADGQTAVFTGKAGTYWIKETQAPDGHIASSEPVRIEINGSHTQTHPLVVTLTNTPKGVVPQLILQKINAKTGQAEKRLAGAEYRIEWIDKNPKEELKDEVASLSWIMKTDEQGEIYLDSDHLVSGNDLILQDGQAILPEGWLRIQETKAPAGFLIDEQVYTIPLESDGSALTTNANHSLSKEQPAQIELIKVDSDTHQPLSDARFTLTDPQGHSLEVTLNAQGKGVLDLNQFGEWTLEESQAPKGYQKIEGKAVFTVNENGIQTTLEGGFKQAGVENFTLTVPNTPTPFDFELNKVSSNNEPLAGATIVFSKDAAGKDVLKTIVSDENGKAEVKGLMEKTFYIAETQAPEGYRLPLGADGKALRHLVEASFDVENRKWSFTIDGLSVDQKPSGFEATGSHTLSWRLVNPKQPVLPSTGKSGWMVPMMGVLALGCGWMMKKREEKKRSGKNE